MRLNNFKWAASPEAILALIAKVESLAAPSAANGAVGEMPELPAADWAYIDASEKEPRVLCYNADQMQAYARAAVLAERACIIQLCEEEAARWQYPSHGNSAVKMLQSLIRART